MNNDECKGCRSFDVNNYECAQAANRLEGKCPCSLCVIKMVCIDACEAYQKFDPGTDWQRLEGIPHYE